VTVGIAIEIEPIREEVIVEVGDGIDAVNPESGVCLAVREIVGCRMKRFAGGVCQKRRVNHIDLLRKSYAGRARQHQ
jgi:hypothetical protein